MVMSAKVATALMLVALLPSFAFGQASIVGSTKDSSGAVLPGVTVEASSPALIEKVRTTVSDASGQFQIADLRPSAYVVTFTLTGFNTVKRDGIELTGTNAAAVNVVMPVGAMAETVTVTGATPIVDVTTTRLRQTMDKEVIDAIPSARQYFNLANLVPAINSGVRDVGGSAGLVPPPPTASGSNGADSRILLDGLSVGATGGGGSMYMTPVATSREVTFNLTGGMGESESPGLTTMIVPRDGGNMFGGSMFFNGAGDNLIGSNFTDDLKSQGLRVPNRLLSVYDFSASFGGPLKRDRLWFFGSTREIGSNNAVAGMYINKNAGNLNSWTYDPDLTKQAENEQLYRGGNLRLTWQASARNKIAVFWDEQYRCQSCVGGGTATQTVEATSRSTASPMRVSQITWNSPVTNNLFAEAGFSLFGHRQVAGGPVNGGRPREDGTRNPDLIRVVEQAGAIPGLSYRQPTLYGHHWAQTTVWRGAISRITGSHSSKFGYDGGYHPRELNFSSDNGLSYRFNNGVPNQLTQYATPYSAPSYAHTTGLYAQDQWVLGRLTLQGGIRYDYLHMTYPAQQLGPSKLYPIVVQFAASDSYQWHDVTPRMGAAYNLFGNGKTAIKVQVGKYVSQGVLSPNGGDPDDFNPVLRMATNTTRAWTDANGNYKADCDLANGAAQDLRSVGGDLCGAFANANFGTNRFSSTFNPAYVKGWSVRPYQWVITPSIQQELWSQVSLNLGYVRRVGGNFPITDNIAASAADFDRYTVTAPADARLPGGGNYPVSGLYDIRPDKFGQTNNYRTLAGDYGKQIAHYDGFNLDVRARRGTLTVQGGLSSGKTTTDNCEIVKRVPEVLPAGLGDGSCHVATPFLTNYKGLAAYTIPRVAVQVSGTYQNLPGAEFSGNYNAPNAAVIPSLGRPLSGNAPNVLVNLLAPSSEYGERYSQVDLRVAKVLRFGKAKALVSFDLYNTINNNAIQTYNNTFIPNGTWLIPTAIESPRVAKFGLQLDF